MYSSISPPLLKPLLILFEPSEVTLAPYGIRICDFWLFKNLIQVIAAKYQKSLNNRRGLLTLMSLSLLNK